MRSSSTRRTWIEIRLKERTCRNDESRPPHGGRGLKSGSHRKPAACVPSSSTRRTWIEIAWAERAGQGLNGRPPHGGRGLKFGAGFAHREAANVVLHTEDVD